MSDMDHNRCPVCEEIHGGESHVRRASGDNFSFICEVCGDYTVDDRAYNWLTTHKDKHGEPHELHEITELERALISHKLRTMQGSEIRINTQWLEHLLENETLPTPAMQAANLIRFIGGEVLKTGRSIDKFPVALHAIIGAPNPVAAIELADELHDTGNIKLNSDWMEESIQYRGRHAAEANLTLHGWGIYETEKRGQFSGDYGFLAMEFGPPDLENFVENTLKPVIKEKLGYELHDMRDAAQAGIIDNIMRVKIRDSRFVIADLTHGNRGAYFEAGYAEALGKPVIYICEKKKFEEEKTHFDTNHCTTIPWAKGEESEFTEKLIATLKRSLE